MPAAVFIAKPSLLGDVGGREHEVDSMYVVRKLTAADGVLHDRQDRGVAQTRALRVVIGGFTAKAGSARNRRRTRAVALVQLEIRRVADANGEIAQNLLPVRRVRAIRLVPVSV